MNFKIEDNTIYRTSSAVAIEDIGNNRYAVWNRYFPSILFLNKDGIKFLKYMSINNNPYKKFMGFKRILRKMISNNLMYSGPEDAYKNEFLQSGELLLEKISKSMCKHYNERLPYGTLTIFNYTCNLKCPYCVVNYVRSGNHVRVKKTKGEKINRLLNCIDKLLHNSESGKEWVGRIVFNGGEIILEWEMIKAVVIYIKSKYPRAQVEFDINTNATLITEEIAKFFAQNKFKNIGISIDGYRETHNKTRCYRDGTGSFDDVIRGLNILNRHLPHHIESYQGTLVREHELEIEKLMDMKNYGFKRARLGVNLLGITQEDAKQMADLLFKIATTSIECGWNVEDNYFISYKSILNTKDTKFTFYCRGFTDFSAKILYYNFDTQMVNIVCNYATDVQVSLDEINDDIYHPSIFEKGLNFLHRRFETFKEACGNCEIAGICRGGCILRGIDPLNNKNEAACQFQKEMWKNFLKYNYSHND
jgi:radical SAM protein with 4Fe4S-binding SPASM domain